MRYSLIYFLKLRRLVLDPLARRARQALALAGTLSLFGCSSGPPAAQGPATIPAVPVTVADVAQKSVPVVIRSIGNVEAFSTVAVKSQVEGQLQYVGFKEGQNVRLGNVLFRIDPRPFEVALQHAAANLARDQAQLKNAQAQAERYARLYQDGIASKEQHDQVWTNFEALEAAVKADQAVVEEAKVQLGYCTIRSAIDGRTGSLLVHEGNIVKANETTLVVINQLVPVDVSFSVPEQYLAEIKARMAAGPLRVEATIPEDEATPAEGRLKFVDNTVDRATGTIRLKATFANSDRRLWPGQFVNAALALSAKPHAVVVASHAVQTGQQGQYVYVVKQDQSVDFRPVFSTMTAGSDAVIEKGLQPGETVVTDGQLRLFPGAKVEIKKNL